MTRDEIRARLLSSECFFSFADRPVTTTYRVRQLEPDLWGISTGVFVAGRGNRWEPVGGFRRNGHIWLRPFPPCRERPITVRYRDIDGEWHPAVNEDEWHTKEVCCDIICSRKVEAEFRQYWAPLFRYVFGNGETPDFKLTIASDEWSGRSIVWDQPEPDEKKRTVEVVGAIHDYDPTVQS
jgi:hypothetical protein